MGPRPVPENHSAQGGAALIPSRFAAAPQSVLIVDRSEESREVLRTVLGRRGLRILEATEARQGLELARRHHPGVIVLDLETESADDDAVRDQYDVQSTREGASLVVLGRSVRSAPARGAVVSKPYHFAPLIRKIEELLDLEVPRERTQAEGVV
jgi:CheY-like chemotaxis protein